VPLTDKVFELLLLLVQNPGRALSKVELMQRLWPDTVVEENNLTVNVSSLRKALGESPGERRYIETLARRGYRFVAEVRKVSAPAPAPAPAVTSAVSAAADVDAASRPFVGRERELERLNGLLEATLAARGRVVFVIGGPGMGKTALSQHFLTRAQRSQPALIVARGRCLEQLGSAEAYLPFLEALQSLLASADAPLVTQLLEQHAPSWCSAFPALASRNARSSSAGANASRMLRELGDLLEALARQRPLLLLLEDLHWADPSSTDAVRLLAQRIGERRVLVLATFRRDEVERDHHPLQSVRRELLAHELCEEIALPLLGESYITSYLDARCPGHDFPPELAQLIVRTTEGQPLFATRLVELWIERGAIAPRDGAWHLTCALSELSPGVPETVRALIEKKLESLDEADQRALAYASAIGVELNASVLARVLGEDEVALEERLDRLARSHRLIELLGEEKLPDGRIDVRYRFAHVLYQNVLHDGLARKRRIALHAAVAAALSARYAGETRRIAAQLALHYREAREPALAIRHLLIAGDNASRVHASRESRQYCLEAFALLPELPARERVAHELIVLYNRGWTEFKVRDYEACLAAFERMLACARAPEFAAEGEACEQARETVFAYLAEPWRDSFGVLEQPRMPKQDPSHGAAAVQCEAYWAIVLVLSYLNRLDARAARLGEYLALARATHNEPRRLEAIALLGVLRLEQGQHAEGVRLLDECIPAARAIDHARALSVAVGARALVHHLRCELTLAEGYYRECMSLVIDAPGRIECLVGRGLCHAHLGQVTPALAVLEEALDIARRAEQSDASILAANALGDLWLELGDVERARAQYRHSLELAGRHAFVLGELLSWINQGRAALVLGERELAAEALRRVDELLPQRSRGAHDMLLPMQFQRRWLERSVLALRAEVALCAGELERAREHAAQLLRDAHDWGSPHAAASARLLLGHGERAHGRLERAEAELAAGSAALAAYPAPFIALRLLAAQAEVRRAAHDPAGAAAKAAQARAIIEPIASAITEPALRALWAESASARLAAATASGA
jgi:DNA-binding winged helix-turn-helix (wHTH) protein/tetratricopeptide (TPR) repeat protein